MTKLGWMSLHTAALWLGHQSDDLYIDSLTMTGGVGPRFLLVNQHEVALEMNTALPLSVVIFRRTYDDNEHRTRTAQAILQDHASLIGDNRDIWLYFNNEPNPPAGMNDTGKRGFWRSVIDHAIEVYKLCSENGYTAIGPNFGAKWPLMEDAYLWNDPEYLPRLIAASNQYRQPLGFHIYAPGRIGLLPDPADNILHTPSGEWRITPEFFTENIDRMIRLGMKACVITECGYDNVAGYGGAVHHLNIAAGDMADDMRRLASYFEPYKNIVHGATLFCWQPAPGQEWDHFDLRNFTDAEGNFLHLLGKHDWTAFGDWDRGDVFKETSGPTPVIFWRRWLLALANVLDQLAKRLTQIATK